MIQSLCILMVSSLLVHKVVFLKMIIILKRKFYSTTTIKVIGVFFLLYDHVGSLT